LGVFEPKTIKNQQKLTDKRFVHLLFQFPGDSQTFPTNLGRIGKKMTFGNHFGKVAY
jgi:hypothetical protein